MAKKPPGDLGGYRIAESKAGQTVEHIPAALPVNKEEREAFFGDRFVAYFNEHRLLGPEVSIDAATQQGTDDLDYRIVCATADFLELAEITPLSEEWGREAQKTGEIDVYQIGKWVWQNVIQVKAAKYGQVSRRTFLLLYSTQMPLMISQGTLSLLRSTLQHKGSPFAGVFYEVVIFGETAVVETIAPWPDRLPSPRHYKGGKLWNLKFS